MAARTSASRVALPASGGGAVRSRVSRVSRAAFEPRHQVARQLVAEGAQVGLVLERVELRQPGLEGEQRGARALGARAQLLVDRLGHQQHRRRRFQSRGVARDVEAAAERGPGFRGEPDVGNQEERLLARRELRHLRPRFGQVGRLRDHVARCSEPLDHHPEHLGLVVHQQHRRPRGRGRRLCRLLEQQLLERRLLERRLLDQQLLERQVGVGLRGRGCGVELDRSSGFGRRGIGAGESRGCWSRFERRRHERRLERGGRVAPVLVELLGEVQHHLFGIDAVRQHFLREVAPGQRHRHFLGQVEGEVALAEPDQPLQDGGDPLAHDAVSRDALRRIEGWQRWDVPGVA